MSPPLPARRRSADLFPVFPVTVAIFAIAVLGCSAIEGALRSPGALMMLVSLVLAALFAIGVVTLARRRVLAVASQGRGSPGRAPWGSLPEALAEPGYVPSCT